MNNHNYRIEKTDSFFNANRHLVESEIAFGRTVCLVEIVNLEKIEKIRSQVDSTSKPSYTAFVARALALTLKEFPFANRRICRFLGFGPARFQVFDEINIAVASEVNIAGKEYVAYADILKNADKASFKEISQWLRTYGSDFKKNPQWISFSRIIERTPNWLSAFILGFAKYSASFWANYRGGAAMISSPGKYGSDFVIGAWPCPIGVSFGFAKERPLVIDHQVVAKPTFYLTLNFDRRVMAGAPAARFLSALIRRLENPD